jgi:CDGSH-type Zn-finger protein
VSEHADPATITVYPDGPLLVRGCFEIRSADGRVIESDRSVVALCRCGRSRLKPLCDGSHKLARFSDSASAEEVSHVLEFARPGTRRNDVDRDDINLD